MFKLIANDIITCAHEPMAVAHLAIISRHSIGQVIRINGSAWDSCATIIRKDMAAVQRFRAVHRIFVKLVRTDDECVISTENRKTVMCYMCAGAQSLREKDFEAVLACTVWHDVICNEFSMSRDSVKHVVCLQGVQLQPPYEFLQTGIPKRHLLQSRTSVRVCTASMQFDYALNTRGMNVHSLMAQLRSQNALSVLLAAESLLDQTQVMEDIDMAELATSLQMALREEHADFVVIKLMMLLARVIKNGSTSVSADICIPLDKLRHRTGSFAVSGMASALHDKLMGEQRDEESWGLSASTIRGILRCDKCLDTGALISFSCGHSICQGCINPAWNGECQAVCDRCNARQTNKLAHSRALSTLQETITM